MVIGRREEVDGKEGLLGGGQGRDEEQGVGEGLTQEYADEEGEEDLEIGVEALKNGEEGDEEEEEEEEEMGTKELRQIQ